jgi:hypothetical protein
MGLGVAAAVAPTKAYSFLGGILRPRPVFDFTPTATYMLESSNDIVSWGPYTGPVKFEITKVSKCRGILDSLTILGKDDILDVGGMGQLPQRYLRVVQLLPFSQPNDPQSFSVSPIT